MTTPSHPSAVTPVHLAVIGAGYVGLTAAACMAESGHDVTCLEASPHRLGMLLEGVMPIYEPGLGEMVARNVAAGRLRFTDSVEEAVRGVRHAFLCVGTPPRPDGTPDLTQISRAARDLAAAASSDLVLVVKSTVPPGTCEALEILASEAAAPDVIVRVASNPEFLRESRAVEDFFNPDRIVVGADDPELGHEIADLYPAGHPVLVSDRRSSELIKYAANTFLAVKISFANEVAGLCELLGAGADDVLAGVGLDNRIGTAFLRPGPGFGGSCLPKDLSGFMATASSLGFATPVAAAALAVNERAPVAVVDKLEAALGHLDGRRVAVLGVAFKPGTDDTRDSPAIALVRALAERGAVVTVHDPMARIGDLPARTASDPLEAAHDADAVVVATGWPEYAELQPEVVRETMAGRVLADTAGVLDSDAWQRAGFSIYGVGRGLPTSLRPVVWQPITWATPAPAPAAPAVPAGGPTKPLPVM